LRSTRGRTTIAQTVAPSGVFTGTSRATT